MLIILNESIISAHLGLVSVLFLHHQKLCDKIIEDAERGDEDDERYGEVSVEKFLGIFSLENKWLRGDMVDRSL